MSHHKHEIVTIRITNEGRILSYWFKNPYTGELIFTSNEEEEE